MGILNAKAELVSRLSDKTLEAQFLAIITDGLNCSPFEGRLSCRPSRRSTGPTSAPRGPRLRRGASR